MNDANNLLYCEICKNLKDEERCSKCKSKRRPPENGDFSYLVTIHNIYTHLLTDALAEFDIPCVAIPEVGAVMRLMASFSKQNDQIYVPYEHLSQAYEVYLSILGNESATEITN